MKKDLLTIPKDYDSLKEAIVVSDTIYALTKKYVPYDEMVWVNFDTFLWTFNYDVLSWTIYIVNPNGMNINNLLSIWFKKDNSEDNRYIANVSDLDLNLSFA